MQRTLRAAVAAAVTVIVTSLAAVTGAPSGAAALADGAPTAPALRVERLTGEPVAAKRLIALDGKKLTVDGEAGAVDIPLEDVVEMSFATAPDAARPASSAEIAADLWSGETVLGELRGGDGERVEIDTPLIGRVKIPLENLAAVRFLQRLAQAAEPPDLRPRGDTDVIHLIGGDQFSGTLEGFTATTLQAVTTQKDAADIPYDRLVAVCLMKDEQRAAAKPEGAVRVALRDGTRVLGREPRLEGGRLRMKSPSGFDVDCAPGDIVALQNVSSRFAFLSDLPTASVTVKPVWEVAAGSPELLYAPRFDRSFSGKALRSGGRTWLDGIGVFSGTTLTWNLDGKYREFHTAAGLDDGAGPLGGVVFQVLVDGKEAWNSGFVRPSKSEGRGATSPVTSPRIPLTGAKTLSLVVLAGDAEDPYPVQDEADWLGPILIATERSSVK